MPKAVQFDSYGGAMSGVFALEDVRDAFRQVEQRHTRGKVVLRSGTK